MKLLPTIRDVLHDFREKPIQAAQFAVSATFKPGFNILDDEWDLAVILDTCRSDALREVAQEYSSINNIRTRWSNGGATPEWLANTFTTNRADDCAEIGYITANGFTAGVFEERCLPQDRVDTSNIPAKYSPVYPEAFAFIDHIWRSGSGWEGIGEAHPPASCVTNQTIWRWRNSDVDRLIAHYIQPHAPYVGHAKQSGRDYLKDFEQDPFGYLNETTDLETVWDAYLTELRCGLDEVAVLLNNVDAESVVITADHGDAFGEYNAYGHRTGMLQPPVRKVPWVRTTSTDNQTRHPDPIQTSSMEGSVVQQLEALGYR